ncbi:uncharacterized protein LOC142488083 [Ascaphus truei]|uniref:uncharacterized protein LOC142488083 n=1 Tax=Ascaphus truei TaxID=8439 RepID=UPI003F5A0DFD
MIKNAGLAGDWHRRQLNGKFYGSNHHPKWIQNIPLSQFNRLIRNCSTLSAFDDQSHRLISQFISKGYVADTIQDSYNKLDVPNDPSVLDFWNTDEPLLKKIQHQRVHATGTGGGPTPQRLILSPLEELLRAKLLPVVVEGLPGDRDIGIYPSQFPPVAPEGHVSPETEQVSSPGSASSTHLEEHDEEDYDDDDDDATAIDTQIEASDHEDVPIETVLPPNRPANTTYDAIVASEGKIVEAENRRHSDFMTVLERMIALQEETVSQLAHLHRVFIEVPKQLQKINTSFEALVVQQTQANYWRMTNVPQFNTSQPGSVHAGQFSPHSSDIHSPGPNVTGQVADIAVQVPDDILPLPSVQIQQQTPTKEPTKTKHKQLLLTSFWSKTTKDTHETDQPSLVQCLPTSSHVSVGTSPVREQSLPKSPVAL